MFIQTEETPNPATLKFLPGETVLENRTVNFTNKTDAAVSPLAKNLFLVDGVTGVFFGSDFISVSKQADISWDILKPAILEIIMQHFTSETPLFVEQDAAAKPSTASHEANEDDDEVVKEIKELLDTRVRPAVAMDGGDIIFNRYEEGVVYLELHGACSGCPSSTATLKMGIENMLRYYIPEIQSVQPVDENGDPVAEIPMPPY